MQRILFYSFKGGTGRTTATANVGVELARRGHNVLLVDLDIEGGGLHIVLGGKEKGKRTIQEYLSMDQDLPQPPPIQEFLHETDPRLGSSSSSLLLLPAFQGPDTKNKKVPNFQEHEIYYRLQSLWKDLKKELDFPIHYALLDSPPGFGDMTHAALGSCDGIFILYRINWQSLSGTMEMADTLNKWKVGRKGPFAPGGPLKDFYLVGSGVPTADPKLASRVKKAEAYMSASLRVAGIAKEPIVTIPDCPELRYDEEVVTHTRTPVYTNVRKSYRQLADRIEAMFPAGDAS